MRTPPDTARAATPAASSASRQAGPIYESKRVSGPLLWNSFCNSLCRAAELRAATVAFPAISCGVYGYPAEDAAHLAYEVRVCEFSEPTQSGRGGQQGGSEGRTNFVELRHPAELVL